MSFEFKSEYPANTWDWLRMSEKDLSHWKQGDNLAEVATHLWKDYDGFTKVLDLGTGLGSAARKFAEKGFDVCALDIDPVPLNLAKKYSNGLNIDYKVGDMLNIPYESESFQCVYATNIIGLTYTKGLYRAIDEIHRVLTKNGGVFLTVSSKESDLFKYGLKIDNNSVIGRVQYGQKVSTYCFIDDAMIPGLFNGFNVVKKHRLDNSNHYAIIAQKVGSRNR